MVSNTDAPEIRKLAKFVQEERERSSKPLCPHVCAACGQLLPAPVNDNQLHKVGAAFQILGQSCAGDAMPPFLLLFSKSLIGRRLPSIFAFDPRSPILKG